jgi:hypothetical protein
MGTKEPGVSCGYWRGTAYRSRPVSTGANESNEFADYRAKPNTMVCPSGSTDGRRHRRGKS